MTRPARTILLAWLCLALAGCGKARTQLRVGDQAPEFTLTDQNNREVRLRDFRDKKNVVLTFYVKASTST